MAACAVEGCSTEATYKVTDYRRRGAGNVPTVRLTCSWHAERLGQTKGTTVRELRAAGSEKSSVARIDIRGALDRIRSLEQRKEVNEQ